MLQLAILYNASLMTSSKQPHLTVAAVIEKNGRFLMIEEQVRGTWLLNQPAGHVQAGETLLEAVQRETCEEAASVVEPRALIGMVQWQAQRNQEYYLRIVFAADFIRGLDQPLDDGIHAVHWLSLEEIRAHKLKPRNPAVLSAIESYLAGNLYPLDLLEAV